MDERVIMHVDCNGFYASVELLARPDLADKAVAVAGDPSSRHGIILAKNEAAKKFGVQTAETIWQAKRKCPDLVLLAPRHREYTKYYHILNKIYAQYSDRVQPFGIDESWIDVSGSWKLFASSPYALANELRERVKKETRLTVSIGLSFNKIFAKLGSDYKKPDAVTEITRENFKEILWPLPVGAMLMVGSKTQKTLQDLSVSTVGELAAAKPAILEMVLGKLGPVLHKYANGEDDEPVSLAGEQEQPKSVGNGMTFKRNLLGRQDVRTGIAALSDEVGMRLRRYNLYAVVVQVTIKTPDFKTITRQKQLPYASNLARDISNTAQELIDKNWDYIKPIRMLTVTAQQLTTHPLAVQTSLFGQQEAPSKRTEKLERSKDAIRSKFGRYAVLSAAEIRNSMGLHADARPDDGGMEEDVPDKLDFLDD